VCFYGASSPISFRNVGSRKTCVARGVDSDVYDVWVQYSITLSI
jgi:hypothetical protein